MDIQQAVITLHDIARKVEKADPELGKDIRTCADRLNQKSSWLDDNDLNDIRRAI